MATCISEDMSGKSSPSCQCIILQLTLFKGMFKRAVTATSNDERFKMPIPHGPTVLSIATSLEQWMEDNNNSHELSLFTTKLIEKMGKCFIPCKDKTLRSIIIN